MANWKSKTLFGAAALVSLSVGVGAAIGKAAPKEVKAVTDYSDFWSGFSVEDAGYGNNFRKALGNFIQSYSGHQKTCSYKSLNGILPFSDAYPADRGKDSPRVVGFYHPETYIATSWNKEHTWPNSRGAGESGPGSDPQVIRPTSTSDNSGRGNSLFGFRTPGKTRTDSDSWDPYECCQYEMSRGESARIILYAATRYWNTCGKGSNPLSLIDKVPDTASNPENSSNQMGDLSCLIEWNNTYPVTMMERYRNNYLTSQGYARNPFIDHRDWANYIWAFNGTKYDYRTSVYSGDIQYAQVDAENDINDQTDAGDYYQEIPTDPDDSSESSTDTSETSESSESSTDTSETSESSEIPPDTSETSEVPPDTSETEVTPPSSEDSSSSSVTPPPSKPDSSSSKPADDKKDSKWSWEGASEVQMGCSSALVSTLAAASLATLGIGFIAHRKSKKTHRPKDED